MAVSLASTNGLLNEATPVRHPSVVLQDINYRRTVSSQLEMDWTWGFEKQQNFDDSSAQGAVILTPLK